MDYLKDKLVELSGPPLSETDITEFENKFAVKFPDEYRQFMLHHNGGLITGKNWANPDQGVVMVTWKSNSRAENKQVVVFAGDLLKLTGDEYDLDTLVYELEMMNELGGAGIVLPEGSVPIGQEAGGMKFVLVTKGPQTGAIMLWDRSMITAISTDDLGYIAPSFSAFISSLLPEPDDWDELENRAASLADPRDK